MKTLGLDLGSRQVKLAIMDEQGLVSQQLWHTAYFYRNLCGPSAVMHQGMEEGHQPSFSYAQPHAPSLQLFTEKLENLINQSLSDVKAFVSTGYGRNNIHLEGFTAINELKAHSQGALEQTGQQSFILLDVGGQDVKIMRIEGGQLTDMNLNDKCAASCGRFLEQMAEVLDMPLDQLTRLVEEPIALSSTCAVFCESELIGKLAEGKEPAHLAAGVNLSLFKRLQPMLRGFEGEVLWLSGGVSGSLALQHFLKEHYLSVKVLPNAAYNGAIGCCIHGRKSILRRG